MVAALGDFQVGIVSRRQPNPLLRDEIEKWIMRCRQVLVDRLHDLVACLWSGYREQ